MRGLAWYCHPLANGFAIFLRRALSYLAPPRGVAWRGVARRGAARGSQRCDFEAGHQDVLPALTQFNCVSNNYEVRLSICAGVTSSCAHCREGA